MSQIVQKRVNPQLIGLDGNAFSVMGAFQRQARREKWTQKEIDAVLKEAKSSDYNHLLVTIMDYCEAPEDLDRDDNEDDDSHVDDVGGGLGGSGAAWRFQQAEKGKPVREIKE